MFYRKKTRGKLFENSSYRFSMEAPNTPFMRRQSNPQYRDQVMMLSYMVQDNNNNYKLAPTTDKSKRMH